MQAIHRRHFIAGVGAAGLVTLASPGAARSIANPLQRYIRAWERRDLDAIMRCVHPAIDFVGPNVRADGAAAYRASTERFLQLLRGVTARANFGDRHGAMIAYDFDCIAPIGRAPTAELVTFRDGLVATSEIFFDTRPFAAASTGGPS